MVDEKGRLLPDPSHVWAEPRAQTRCVKCGAYKHLSSGFFPCPGHEEEEADTPIYVEVPD